MTGKIEFKLGLSEKELELKKDSKYWNKHVLVENDSGRIISYHKNLLGAYKIARSEGFGLEGLTDFYIENPNQNFAYIA